MKTFRVFLAHAKSEGDLQIEAARHLTAMILEAEAKGRATVEIVLGREDHEANFKRCGSWDGWAADVVERLDFTTRTPIYDAIVVTKRYVGKATAGIIGNALRANRPTFVLENLSLQTVRRVLQVTQSYQDGWEVQS